MKVRQNECYEEDFCRRHSFEAAQEERFCLLQDHMTTQDTYFEAFASYGTKNLICIRSVMDANHNATITRINHIISTQNEDYYHYMQFYQEMCDFLDYHFGNDGQGWHNGVRPMPRGRGGH
ncbi:unnamed protein product [Vicia faba]|uniref:Uncharacterized protein n=1 Tax=Vicia faba TaxID=3906 RepID=A0AAV0ZZC0_VICFA|nr:unnamed protein product [Vicia faba]